MLTEVSGKVNGGDMTALECELGYDLEGVIGGAVVDEDDLVLVFGKLRHGGVYLIRDRAYCQRRAVAGDDKRDLFHGITSFKREVRQDMAHLVHGVGG